MTERYPEQDRIDDRPLSELYRASREEQPGAELDAEILARAQRQAGVRRRRWLLPLSTAAVILLGTSISLTLVERPARLLPEEEEVKSESLAPRSLRETRPAAGMMSEKRKSGLSEERQPKRQQRAASPPAELSRDVAVPMEGFVVEPERLMEEVTPAPISDRGIAKEGLPAEAWIDEMRRLQQKGELESLKRLLASFREHYPDHELPQELAILENQTR